MLRMLIYFLLFLLFMKCHNLTLFIKNLVFSTLQSYDRVNVAQYVLLCVNPSVVILHSPSASSSDPSGSEGACYWEQTVQLFVWDIKYHRQHDLCWCSFRRKGLLSGRLIISPVVWMQSRPKACAS